MVEEIIVVSPRGFCAGVARSIAAVERALELYGAPIYIKHAIVHNATVVQSLEKKGAVTVEDVADIPDGATAVFSAHGSPPEHFVQARRRGIRVIDATCPLVTKVHREMRHFLTAGRSVVYIGHKGHVEGEGVIGEARDMGQDVPIVESVEDVAGLSYPPDTPIAILTQTTLSIDETRMIIQALRERFHDTIEPSAQDICYATTNRQKAIRALARDVDVVIIVGSPTSSNSRRLQEVAQQLGVTAVLVESLEELQLDTFRNVRRIGLSAGASAPEHRVQEIVTHFAAHGAQVRTMDVVAENVQFTLPQEVA